MTLRAQGQAVDGPDDEVSFPCTRRSSISLSKIIPMDLRDLGCSRVAWPEQRPPALRSSSSAAPAAFANKNPFFPPQGGLARNQTGPLLGSAWNAPKCTMWGVNPRRPRARRVRALSCKPVLACEER